MSEPRATTRTVCRCVAAAVAVVLGSVVAACSNATTDVATGVAVRSSAGSESDASALTTSSVLRTSISPEVAPANKAFCESAAAANDASFALGYKQSSEPGYQEWVTRFVETARTSFEEMAAAAPPDIASDVRTLRDTYQRPDAPDFNGSPPDDATAAEERLRLWLRKSCDFAWGIEGGDGSKAPVPGSAQRNRGTPIRTVPPSTR